ncbi:MAG: preprotein translocase subunit SecG [Christensenellales bacterium]
MEILRTILMVILALSGVILIVSVLMQESKSAGLNSSLSGSAESFFSKGKVKGREAKLAMVTKVTAIVFMLLSVALVFINSLISNAAVV